MDTLKPLIYLAGPYRKPNVAHNVRMAVIVGGQIRDNLDVVVCIPHLSLLEDTIIPRGDQYWIDATMDQMRMCDAVYRYSQEYSEGADGEVKEAKRLGIPVFEHPADLAKWVEEWNESKGNPRKPEGPTVAYPA